MNALVSLQSVKDNLRIDTDVEDVEIQRKIEGASTMILRYIQDMTMFQDSSGEIPQDSNGDPIVDADVQAATKLLVGIMYRDPDGAEMEKWLQGYLPFAVTAQIYHLRLPTLA
jgi:hypothetical protein